MTPVNAQCRGFFTQRLTPRSSTTLKRSGLYNKNYPLRGDNRKGTFYVCATVYVDMVVNAVP